MKIHICVMIAGVLMSAPASAQINRVFSPILAAPIRIGAATSVVVLHPNSQAPSTRQAAPVTASVQIDQLRAAASSSLGVGASAKPASSWSAVISTGSLKSSPAENVAILTSILGANAVYPDYAQFANGGGSIEILATGLKSGSAYVFGCAMVLQKQSTEGFPVTIAVNDQTTEMNATGSAFNGKMAFIAPPDGKVNITVTPGAPSSWFWEQCALGTAS
jgi:hypothetical protein